MKMKELLIYLNEMRQYKICTRKLWALKASGDLPFIQRKPRKECFSKEDFVDFY